MAGEECRRDRSGEGVAVQVHRRQHSHLPERVRDPPADSVTGQVQIGEPFHVSDRGGDGAGDLVPRKQRSTQHSKFPERHRDVAGDAVVAQVEVHQGSEVGEGSRDLAGDLVFGDGEDCETGEPPDVAGDRTGELVADNVEYAEHREGGYARGNRTADVAPVGEDESAEPVQTADGRRDRSCDESRPPWEHGGGRQIHRLSVEVDPRDAAVGHVAADAVPFRAAFRALPRREHADVRVLEGGLEGEESLEIGRRAALDNLWSCCEEDEEDDDGERHGRWHHWRVTFCETVAEAPCFYTTTKRPIN